MIGLDDISVYIPSSGRSEMAFYMQRYLLPSSTIVVAESEQEDYIRAGIPEGKLSTHPNLLGLSRIRNWIVQHSSTRVTIQLDDDIIYFQCNIGARRRVMKTSDELMSLFLSTSNVAADAGVHLFGWGGIKRPLYFKPDRPFVFTTPISQVLGTVGKDVKWDENLLTVCDIDATLRELELRRIVFVDNRFFANTNPMFETRGGMQRIRSSERRAADLRYLKEKWGPVIDVESKIKSGTSTCKINVKR